MENVWTFFKFLGNSVAAWMWQYLVNVIAHMEYFFIFINSRNKQQKSAVYICFKIADQHKEAQ